MAKKTAEQRREELIAAAARVFMEKGYVATTVSDITREAGSSHGTFYVYFDGKEEVFDAVAQHYVMQTYEKLTSIIGAPDKKAIEKLEEIIRLSRQPTPEEWWIKEFSKPHLIHLRARFAVKSSEMFLPLLAGVIRDAVDEGSIDVPYPEAAAVFLISGAAALRVIVSGIGSLSEQEWALAYDSQARRLLGLPDGTS